ncbi:Flp pilus assembly complex ATPase component TadA [Patescibacteria group bacterium]|nr:Flp pilus assembly complex ATPase component TadA [Patescibacteria group bacterium]
MDQQIPQIKNQENIKESATDILYFEKWLSILGERKATDLHLSVGNVPMIRLDGKITPLVEEDAATAERIEMIVNHLLNDQEKSILEKEKQIVLSRTLKKVMRFRMHIFYARGFLCLSLRHLPDSFPSLENFPNAQVLLNIISSTQGLFIISGPFDSGKTTTARSMISEINKTQEKYITTLELPIEYLIPSEKSVVVQRGVGIDVKNFSDGLDEMHDHDVDVVVVGAIEDAEVLEKAVSMANSGRLVIAIVSAKHVVSVLETLRDLVPEEDRLRILHLLGDALLGISNQLLLPKVGGGRILVVSSMVSTIPIKALIYDGKFDQIPNIMQTSIQQGMVTIDKALAEAVKKGEIILKDAQENAVDINQFNILVSH